MAKSKGKTKETVILIRIPDVEARRGAASLIIQRGDLGHMHQFSYSGLTLRGNLTEAVQTALVALAKLEAAPPPQFSTPNPSDQANNPFTSYTPPDPPDSDESEPDADMDADLDDSEDADVVDEDPAAPDPETNATGDAAPAAVKVAANLQEPPAAARSEPIALAPHTTGDAVPSSTAQMTLF